MTPSESELQRTMDRLLLLIRAGYPVIYIVSHEETRILDYLARIWRVILANDSNKNFARWTAPNHLVTFKKLAAHTGKPHWLDVEGHSSPEIATDDNLPAVEAIEAIVNAKPGTRPYLQNSITLFFDVHYALGNMQGSGDLVRPLRNAAQKLRQEYNENRAQSGPPSKTIIVVAPSAAGLSPELDRDLIRIYFPLPEVDELRKHLDRLLRANTLRFLTNAESDALKADKKAVFGKPEIPDAQEIEVSDTEYQARLMELIAGAGRGLTLDDYTSGLNLFAVQDQQLVAQRIEDMLLLKAKAVTNPALQYTPHVNIDLGGLENIRSWIANYRDAMVSGEAREKYGLPLPKGVMLCGASGGGKSQLAKLIAKDFNLALLRLDVGALFGQYVGESEERVRLALQLAEILAPVVLWIDEIDKAFKGMGNTDNGVAARVFGYFLTWLAEKKNGVFVVATANEYKELIERFPEFGRKGRFNEIFWVSRSSDHERAKIFDIYLKRHWDHLPVAAREVLEKWEGTDPDPWQNEKSDYQAYRTRLVNASDSMTGAEIEYSVELALLKAYLWSRENNGSRVSPEEAKEIILQAVEEVATRKLYQGDALTIFLEREREAKQKGWLIA